jgi:hypothetical protein
MMQSCGAFSNVEADELVKHGCLNVLGVRWCMGFIVVSTRNN